YQCVTSIRLRQLVTLLYVASDRLASLDIPRVNVVLAAGPAEAGGGASGLFSTAQQIGGAVGIAVIGTVFFGSLGNHSLVTAFTHTAPYAAGGLPGVCRALPGAPEDRGRRRPRLSVGLRRPRDPRWPEAPWRRNGPQALSAGPAGPAGPRDFCRGAAACYLGRSPGLAAPRAPSPGVAGGFHATAYGTNQGSGGGFQASRRCREASYNRTAAAFAAFSELAAPAIGMLTTTSLSSRHAPLSPVPSVPTSSSTGWVKSKSNTSRSPRSSVAASTTGRPRARCAATHAAASRGPGARTTGSANSEPVLARTHRGS